MRAIQIQFPEIPQCCKFKTEKQKHVELNRQSISYNKLLSSVESILSSVISSHKFQEGKHLMINFISYQNYTQ